MRRGGSRPREFLVRAVDRLFCVSVKYVCLSILRVCAFVCSNIACWQKAKESVSPWLAMSMLPAPIQQSIVSMAMDSVLLDLERARMEREDFRQGSAIKHSLFTWRTYDRILQSELAEAKEELAEAKEALRDIRYELDDMDGRVPPALADNCNQMHFAVNVVLGVDSDDEMDESE